MNPLKYRKTLFALVTIVFVSHTICRLLAWKKKKITRRQINEVIIFSETCEVEQSKYSAFRSKLPVSNERILYYLSQARYTLDICMYMITNREISYLIQKLHYKGVKVRFIVDAGSAFSVKSEIRRLSKQDAISLRWMKSENTDTIMHHKFCIIDASANINDEKVTPFAMAGSLNWNNQALNGNWESVVVMSEPKIVNFYKNEFEKLWLQSAPKNVHNHTPTR